MARKARRKRSTAPTDNVPALVALHKAGKVDVSEPYAEVRAAAKKAGVALPAQGGRLLGSPRVKAGVTAATGPARRKARRRKAGRRAAPAVETVALGTASADGRLDEARAWIQDEAKRAMNKGDFARPELALMVLRRL